MSQEFVLWVMTIFVIVSAAALCLQAGFLFGMYKSVRKVEEQVSALGPQAKNILAVAESTLSENRVHIAEIGRKAGEVTAKASELLDSAKVQMIRIDELVGDATTRARNQVERAELVMDDTISRVHESVAAIHGGLTAPVRHIQGVAAGIKTAIGVFLSGGRPSVAQATHDEEMFI